MLQHAFEIGRHSCQVWIITGASHSAVILVASHFRLRFWIYRRIFVTYLILELLGFILCQKTNNRL